jgi:hypothetical protein
MTNRNTPQDFNPQLQARLREFTDWWDARGKDLDAANDVRDPLYHYTDMGGLLGILNNQEIWLTSIFHLNDPSELGYGVDMALDIMKSEAKRASDAVKAFCAWVEHLLLKAGARFLVSLWGASAVRATILDSGGPSPTMAEALPLVSHHVCSKSTPIKQMSDWPRK